MLTPERRLAYAVLALFLMTLTSNITVGALLSPDRWLALLTGLVSAALAAAGYLGMRLWAISGAGKS